MLSVTDPGAHARGPGHGGGRHRRPSVPVSANLKPPTCVRSAADAQGELSQAGRRGRQLLNRQPLGGGALSGCVWGAGRVLGRGVSAIADPLRGRARIRSSWFYSSGFGHAGSAPATSPHVFFKGASRVSVPPSGCGISIAACGASSNRRSHEGSVAWSRWCKKTSSGWPHLVAENGEPHGLEVRESDGFDQSVAWRSPG